MERFGKFEILERIGDGGMAEIFLAKPQDASVSKLVAIKRILPQLVGDPSFQEMFRREGSIAMRFRHSSIIAVYEMGAVDGRDYMSMEYFPGKPIAEIMRRMRDTGYTLSILDKVVIIKSIAEALHYIHAFSDYGGSAEIIHRDISPHNIMIGFNGVAKLIDFGIAKEMTNEITQKRVLKGKVAYMSPEQLRGNPLTHLTDIFSLGIVFWELLAQKKLFTGKTVQEVAAKVKECRVPSIADLNPDIPPELSRICLKALTERTHLRYQTAAELVADLNDFLRIMSADNREKNIAHAMKNLFPEELCALKELLKVHEGMQEGLIRSDGSGGIPWKAVNESPPPKSRSKLRRKKGTDWNVSAATAAVALAGAILYQIGPDLKMRLLPSHPAAEIARIQMPAPAPLPAPPVERIVAAQNEEMALLTVHASSNARIWVNGKFMGRTAITGIQLPVGKPATIKVLKENAEKAMTRQFTPEPMSRNIFEMGD